MVEVDCYMIGASSTDSIATQNNRFQGDPVRKKQGTALLDFVIRVWSM